MKRNYSYAIGVMSGTSLDGVDLCYVQFYQDESKNWHYCILATTCYDYPENWVNQLAKAHQMTENQLNKLDISYTELIGYYYINKFIVEFQIKKYILSPHMVIRSFINRKTITRYR